MYLIGEIVEMRQRFPPLMPVRMLRSIDLSLIRQDPEQMFKIFAQHNVSMPVRNLRNASWY
jgi:hypothetical protein